MPPSNLFLFTICTVLALTYGIQNVSRVVRVSSSGIGCDVDDDLPHYATTHLTAEGFPNPIFCERELQRDGRRHESGLAVLAELPKVVRAVGEAHPEELLVFREHVHPDEALRERRGPLARGPSEADIPTSGSEQGDRMGGVPDDVLVVRGGLIARVVGGYRVEDDVEGAFLAGGDSVTDTLFTFSVSWQTSSWTDRGLQLHQPRVYRTYR
jgi:hypothetical protein